MNLIGNVILITLVLGFLLDLIADILNLKKLNQPLPQEFSDIIDHDTYTKSQNYTRENTYFGFIENSFGLIITLIVWFTGGFNYIDQIVRHNFSNEILRGLIFISSLLIGNSILSLPFSIYSTFVIEEKFGFNKTSVKTFILDIIKSAGLSLLIGLPVLALLLYLLSSITALTFLYAWCAIVVISLILQYIAPTVILPIFNKFTPLAEGELRDSIFAFADKVRYPLKNIFVMDGSKRSSKSNAFFTGFGKNKRIAIFDTLIAKHTTSELVSVLAHEIGHFKLKHILSGSVIQYLRIGVMLFLLQFFIKSDDLFSAFFMTDKSIYAGLVFFGMLYSPVDLILSIFMNIRSRKHEFAADNFSAVRTNNPESMISALKKLSEHNLSNLTPHPFYVFLHYSHPPVLKRIEAIKRNLISKSN